MYLCMYALWRYIYENHLSPLFIKQMQIVIAKFTLI